MQTTSPDRRSAPPPRRAATPDGSASLPRARAGRPQRATPRGPQCDVPSRQSRLRQGPDRRSKRRAPIAPPFGLTLRAMIGKRHHRTAGSPRRLLVLSSVLALLALVCFPVLAQADSSGTQYEDALPSPCGTSCKAPTHPTHQAHHSEPPAKTSTSSNGGASAPHTSTEANHSNTSGGGSTDTGTSSKTGSPGTASTDNNGGGTGQGSQDTSPSGGAKAGLHPSNQASASTPASTPDSGGDSSPLVPILIAIAALAAISVGAVMLRQRRQRGGPPPSVSAKAS